MIKNWDIEFDYHYNSSYYTHDKKEHGKIHLENFSLMIKYKFTTDNYFKILGLDLELGNSRIEFNNAPAFLAFVAFLINDFKPIYQFLINKVDPVFLNLIFGLVPIPVSIPILTNYALDMSPIYTTLMDQEYSTMFFRTEVYNSAKDFHADVPAPADLRKTAVMKPNAVEVALNNHLVNTLLHSMANFGDLTVVLTDAMVNNATKYLHIRTSDFKYYMPGLMEYKNAGDVPMELHVTFDKDSKMAIEKEGEIKFLGKAQVAFVIPGKGEPIKLEVTGAAHFSASIYKKFVYASIIGVSLTNVAIVSSEIPKPDVAVMMKEFNTLFKFAANAINIYVLEKPIPVPEEVYLGDLKIRVKDVNLSLAEGIAKLAALLELP